jgi:hypothetical protein
MGKGGGGCGVRYFVRIRMSRIKTLNIFCQNQDVQDLRIFRMDIFRYLIYLSESGCPGFKDFQDGDI